MSRKDKMTVSFNNLADASAQVRNLRQMINNTDISTKNKVLHLLVEAEQSLEKISAYYMKQLKAV